LGVLLLHFFHDGANLGPILEEEEFDDTTSLAFFLLAAGACEVVRMLAEK
jgi:hypothetical protein